MKMKNTLLTNKVKEKTESIKSTEKELVDLKAQFSKMKSLAENYRMLLESEKKK